jgi:electron transport complex protein RnfA
VKNLGLILIGATLINNILLIEQIGVCPALHLTAALRKALKVGLVMTAVMVLSAGVNWLIYHLLLVPLNFIFLKNLFFILTVMAISRTALSVSDRAGINRDVFTAGAGTLFSTNCLLFAATLLVIARDYNFIEAMVQALGSGSGFILIVMVFVPIRERLDRAPISPSFKGMPIYLVTFSLMALAMLGGAGFLGLD